MNVPGATVRGEIAGLVFAVDEERIGDRGVTGEVQIGDRRSEHAAIWRVVRYDTLRETIEGINSQRDAIVEDAVACLEHGVCAAKGRPREARPRRDPEGFRNALPLQARPEIERQTMREVGSKRPVILGENRGFNIVVAVRAAAGEVDGLKELPRSVLDVDGSRRKGTGIGSLGGQGAELELVYAEVMNRSRSPGFAELDPPASRLWVAK